MLQSRWALQHPRWSKKKKKKQQRISPGHENKQWNPQHIWKFTNFISAVVKDERSPSDAAALTRPHGRSRLWGVLRRRLAWWRWQAAGPPSKLWHSRLNFQQPHPPTPTPLAAGCPAPPASLLTLSARGPVLTDCFTPLKCRGNPIWAGSAKLLHSQPTRHDLINQLHADDCNWMNSLAGC